MLFVESCYIGIVVGFFGAANDGHFLLANRGVDFLCALHKADVALDSLFATLAVHLWRHQQEA